ncbi:MAG TPA: hypothetical protein VNO79_12180, partial [Actinomycetota bacterium]|nr:hypothetical protein [Actinomycetota bacterium]
MWEAIVEGWQRWGAARAGRADGRRGIPAEDDPHLPFALRGIIARGEDALWRVARAWAEEDAELRARCDVLEMDIARARAAEEELRERLDRAEEEARAGDATDRKELERLRAERHQVEVRSLAPVPASASLADPAPAAARPVASVEEGSAPSAAEPTVSSPERTASSVAPGADGSTPAADGSAMPTGEDPGTADRLPPLPEGDRAGIHPWLYRLAILAIIAGEFPLNAVAFRLFGEPDLLTAVMTLGLAVVLVGLAHAAGGLLARERPTSRDRFLLWCAAGLPLAAILAVAAIRGVYLEEVAGAHGLGRWLDAASFAAINATIFGGAVLLSYLRH